ncbi:hypothetical protein LIER_43916 [Lithospermum erythrorhizon]|uniref:Uncharacterized protein n=1 Tax=Lithospermum erythrorhizon TaxID=34254 RepID=A0AAV3R9R2_LITER
MLVELILINDWTEEIGTVERSRVLVGKKRSRVSIEEVLNLEELMLDGMGSRKKQRFPSPFEARPSNWMEKMDDEEGGYWSSSEEDQMEMDLDHLRIRRTAKERA